MHRHIACLACLVAASGVIAGTPNVTAVPELSAAGAVAAIAGLGAVVALLRERRNRRD